MDSIVDIFRQRLCEALERSGMTQAELSRRAEIDESSISRYLAGGVAPNIRTVCALANALGLDVGDLVKCDAS